MTHPELPEDWRAQMTAMVSGVAPLDDAMFAGGPVLTPIQQIGVYKSQYRLRIYDALVEEVAGLNALLGDDAETVLWAYLEDHPSRSWTLNRIAIELVPWLEARDAPIEQVEMARLDRAVQRGFESEGGTAVRPEDLASLPDLRLSPAVRLLRNTTNVHLIRSAVLSGGDRPDLQHGLDVPLVIFRRELRMRHWEISPGMWRVLQGISKGGTVLDSLGAVVEEGIVDADALGAMVQQWFKDFVAFDLVQLRRTA